MPVCATFRNDRGMRHTVALGPTPRATVALLSADGYKSLGCAISGLISVPVLSVLLKVVQRNGDRRTDPVLTNKPL